MITRLGVTALLLAVVLTGCGAGGAPQPGSTATDPGGTVADPGDDGGAGGSPIDLPATFPSADVPLIEGDLLFAQDLGTGWSVYVARDDVLAGYDEAVGLLIDAGFSGGTVNQDATGAFGNFTSDTYQVNLQAGDFTDLGIGPSVGYTVVIVG